MIDNECFSQRCDSPDEGMGEEAESDDDAGESGESCHKAAASGNLQ